jgi:hypothetical protein
MKSPIMLVCALVAAMSLPTFAQTATTAKPADAAATEKAAKAAKAEAAREARINKFMEETKVSNPTLYSELTALKEKDPAAFKAKVRDLIKQQNAAKAKNGKAKKTENAAATK